MRKLQIQVFDSFVTTKGDERATKSKKRVEKYAKEEMKALVS